MGVILFILMYVFSIVTFYQVFFNMKYKNRENKEKVKYSLWIWISGIIIMCIPVINIIASIVCLISIFIYNDDCLAIDEVEIDSLFTKKF